MKRSFLLYTLLSLVGCTENVIENIKSTDIGDYYAVIEERTSRTYVDEQIRMRWTAEDHVTVFAQNTYNRTFMFTGKTGDNAGGFRQTSVDDPYWFGYDVANSYAVYPHSTDNKLDETDLFLVLNMPAEQTYAENSFGLDANTMVAVSDNNQLIFKNVGSYLRVRLYGENTSVSSITLTNKGNEAIAGEAKVTPVMDGEPICVMTGSGKSIRLSCPTPVSISSDANDPTDFWMVVPPVTLASGFTVIVENGDGKTQTYDVDKSFTFERNKYNNMVREVNIEPNIPYVTFTADATQTLTMSKAVQTLEYSVNGGEWKELGVNTVVFGGEYGILQLRGKSSIGTANSSTDYSKISFGNSSPVVCSGDIRTLVDYNKYTTVDTSNAKFCNLFNRCVSLTSSPELPAMSLSEECYHGMFSYCENLTIAPQLPAIQLTEWCYASMFAQCDNLSSAPELPATTLSKNCYRGMFAGCNLVSAPELPATTLADFCYMGMFSYCPLTSAPELPASTLARSCYEGMFSSCDKLTIAPELKAVTLSDSCYMKMFSFCTSLSIAPELPATTLTESCYQEMFSRCEKLTQAPKLPATILERSCYLWMFSGCYNLTSAPELPATIMAESCYYGMFDQCYLLSSAPELPATILAKNCYLWMFSRCTKLKSAPELPATTLAESCYARMFLGCTSLERAPELPAATLTVSCYKEMFMDCTNLATAPILSATSLNYYCYQEMFRGCSKLANVTMLATSKLDSYYFALDNWLSGVSSTGVFTKAKEVESLPIGVSGIPEGWTVVDKP